MKNIFYNTIKTSLDLLTRLYVKKVVLPFLLAMVCAFASCSSDDDKQQDDKEAVEDDTNKGEDGGRETDQDAGDQLGEDGITLSWKVTQNSESSLWDRLEQPRPEGVEVCLIESIDIPCVYTDDEGFFVLEGVPQNRELLLTFTKEDYLSFLVTARTGTSDFESALFTAPVMITTKT
jgi:hypothetical protein